MGGVDRYLEHAFDTADDERVLPGERRSFQGSAEREPTLPILVRVARPDQAAQVAAAAGCLVSSQMGDIVACRGDRDAIAVLSKDPRVISVEASRPGSGPDCSRSVPFIGADRVHSDPRLAEKGNRALVGVVDGGIDVIHEAFLGADRKTRIHAVWDQTDTAGLPPMLQGKRAYGTLHTRADIDGYIAAQAALKGLAARDPGGHGTHVASIAAGRACGSFFGGVAPEARIVVVISSIRVDPFDPTSAGYSNSHLDALAFIDEVATELNLPVVVNVSQGMNAGAHDGTSNVEAGFDNFSGGGRRPGRVVVKSAGNERAQAGHAKLVLGPGGADEFTWRSRTLHSGPDVLEVWFSAADDVKLQLKDPNGEISDWVTAGQSDSGKFTSGVKHQVSYEKYHWDNGDGRALITISRGTAPYIDADPPGEHWSLAVEAVSIRAGGEMHAWLERDNSRPIEFLAHVSEEMTLSVPGTARTVLAVASINASKPVRVAKYSSYGPTRDQRDKPDVAAPGEEVNAARSGTSNGVIPMSGTSMAAPHVAGMIALLLSRREKQRAADSTGRTRQFNAAQIRAALCQNPQGFIGRATPASGFGVIDAKALLDKLA